MMTAEMTLTVHFIEMGIQTAKLCHRNYFKKKYHLKDHSNLHNKDKLIYLFPQTTIRFLVFFLGGGGYK